MKHIFLTLFALLTFISCKEEAKKDETVEAPKEKIVDLKVICKVKVLNDDSYQLFFKEDLDVSLPFKEENSVWVEFKGSENVQDIVFELPENVFPNFFRIDTGVNPKNENVQILSMTIVYKDKSFEILPAKYNDFFFTTEFIKDLNPADGTFKTVQKGDAFDPHFFSGDNLRYELEKLFK